MQGVDAQVSGKSLMGDLPAIRCNGIMLPSWWDWNVSARARMASLASAWVLVAFASAPFGIIAFFAGLRFCTSIVQTFWNHRLDRVEPLGPRGLIDWAMFAAALGMSILVAQMQQDGVALAAPIAFSMVLAPLSIIQLRAVRKSLVVHEQALASRKVVALRIAGQEELARAA